MRQFSSTFSLVVLLIVGLGASSHSFANEQPTKEEVLQYLKTNAVDHEAYPDMVEAYHQLAREGQIGKWKVMKRRASLFVRHFYEKYGYLGAALAVSFALDPILDPPLQVAIAVAFAKLGTYGFLLSPLALVLGHQEIPVGLAFVIAVRLKGTVPKWRIVAPDRFLGDRKTYNAAFEYEVATSAGDPENIIARGVFDFPLNVVQSSLLPHFPLSLSRILDRRVRHHALNITTNELVYILGEIEDAEELLEDTGLDFKVFVQLILRAIQKNPEAQQRFDVVVGHRYFKAMASQALESKTLNADEQELLRNAAADFFLVSSMLKKNPELARDQKFWSTLLDYMVHDYPGKKMRGWRTRHLKRVAERMHLLSAMLIKHGRGSFYMGSLFVGDGIMIDPHLGLSFPAPLRSRGVLNRVRSVFGVAYNSWVMKKHLKNSALKLSRVSAELDWFLSRNQLSALDQAFREKIQAQENANQLAREMDDFIERNLSSKPMAKMKKRFLQLKYRWLQMRMKHQATGLVQDVDVEGYQDMRKDFEQLKTEVFQIKPISDCEAELVS